MKLSELAFGCYIYNWFTDYDDSYIDFKNAVNNSLDLNTSDHRKELIKLLNKWGCRQFSLDYHDFASKEILSWYKKYNPNFVSKNKTLWQLSKQEIEMASEAYESLANKIASYRTRKGKIYPVSIGPTGSSKILFNIRPKAYLLWDEAIRDNFGFDGSKNSYYNFLSDVKSILEELEGDCHKYGISLLDLPRIMKRQESTVIKLIDEYYWVTITNGCEPPDDITFHNWNKWRI